MGARGESFFSIFLERILHIEPIFWFVSRGFGKDCSYYLPSKIRRFWQGDRSEFKATNILRKSRNLNVKIKVWQTWSAKYC